MSAKITRVPNFPLDSGGTAPNFAAPYTTGDIIKPYGTPSPGEIYTSEDGSIFIGCVVPTALAGAGNVSGEVSGSTAGAGQPVKITEPVATSAWSGGAVGFATAKAWPEAIIIPSSTQTNLKIGICTRNVTAADIAAGNNLAWVQIAGPSIALVCGTTDIVVGDTLKVVQGAVDLIHNDAAGTITNYLLAMAIALEGITTDTTYTLRKVMLLGKLANIA
jgi:hypothetical protein